MFSPVFLRCQLQPLTSVFFFLHIFVSEKWDFSELAMPVKYTEQRFKYWQAKCNIFKLLFGSENLGE